MRILYCDSMRFLKPGFPHCFIEILLYGVISTKMKWLSTLRIMSARGERLYLLSSNYRQFYVFISVPLLQVGGGARVCSGPAGICVRQTLALVSSTQTTRGLSRAPGTLYRGWTSTRVCVQLLHI